MEREYGSLYLSPGDREALGLSQQVIEVGWAPALFDRLVKRIITYRWQEHRLAYSEPIGTPVTTHMAKTAGMIDRLEAMERTKTELGELALSEIVRDALGGVAGLDRSRLCEK